MAAAEYRGVSGVARKVVKEYRGVSGVGRRVTKAYRGVSGVARKYFGKLYSVTLYKGVTNNNSGVTLHSDSYAREIFNGQLELSVHATATKDTDDRANAVAKLSDYDFASKTIEFTVSTSGTGGYRDAVCVFYDANGTMISYFNINSSSVDEKTFTRTTRSDTKSIGFIVNDGARGEYTVSLTVKSLKVDGEVLI